MADIYPIPKEVKGENKIALNMNAKQLISCGVALALDVLIYFAFHLETSQMMLVTLILVGCALLVSSKTIDGVSVWHYVYDYVRKIAFHYDKRKYRTKNKVIVSLNNKYSQMRAEDMQNKRIAKKIMHQEKKKAKKHTRLKVIY